MFIGGSKKAVVDNIARAAEAGQFYDKVEVDDPDLTEDEKSALIRKFLKKHKTPAYDMANWGARCITDTVSWIENKNTEYVGLDNIRGITTGAIITSNHFNPLDNTVVREALKKMGKMRMSTYSSYISSSDRSLLMEISPFSNASSQVCTMVYRTCLRFTSFCSFSAFWIFCKEVSMSFSVFS